MFTNPSNKRKRKKGNFSEVKNHRIKIFFQIWETIHTRDILSKRCILSKGGFIFFPFSFVKCNFLGINHSKNIKFGENMCNGVIFQKITKNGIFYQVSHICGSSMTLGRGDIFQKKKSTPIIPVFVFFHFNIRSWMKISRFFMLYWYMVYISYLQ